MRAERSASAESAAPSTPRIESIASSSRSTTRCTRTASASRERSGRLALSMCSPAFGLAGLAGSGLALDRLGLDRLGLDRLRALPLALVARPDDVPRARLDFRSGGAVRAGQPHSAIRA